MDTNNLFSGERGESECSDSAYCDVAARLKPHSEAPSCLRSRLLFLGKHGFYCGVAALFEATPEGAILLEVASSVH